MPHPSAEVDAYLDDLDHPLASDVRSLRDAILAVDDRITEHIKWKAPSFVVDGDDRVTFALRPGKGLELILHRGVTVRADTEGFRFEDHSDIVRWATPDRGIVSMPDATAVREKRATVLDLVRRWIDTV